MYDNTLGFVLSYKTLPPHRPTECFLEFRMTIEIIEKLFCQSKWIWYLDCLMFTTFTAGKLNATSTEMLIPDVAGNLHVTDGTLVENISQLTGKLTSMLLGIDLPDFIHDFQSWQSGALIQDAFPELSADAREFIKTGITPEEWEAMFGEE